MDDLAQEPRSSQGSLPATITLKGTLRDFKVEHPDFEYVIGDDLGIVTADLGADGKPVYASTTSTYTTTGKANFDQWFRDEPGVNLTTSHEITLERVSVDPPLYRYSNSSFFPIDDQLNGNEGNAHNYHFTYELHTEFRYTGGENFTFIGDDDVWVYINGKRVIDLGGVHAAQTASVDLDAVADEIGMTLDGVYTLDFFFAERHLVESNFKIETSIASFEDCAAPITSGFVGLDLVDISGNATITGDFGSVFSNTLVQLAGSYELDGDAISGGTVELSGNQQPKGAIIQGADLITASDPAPAVAAAKITNDNASIPCVQGKKKCTSPVEDYIFSLNNNSLTLTSGVYYFEGVTINGNAQLNVDGNVVIYLDGPATFNGGAATNPDGDSLTIISSSTEEIKFNGGGSTATHVLAPFATVRFSGTQGFIGSALARELRISGTADLTGSADLVAQSADGCDEGDDTGLPGFIPDLPH